MTAKELEKALNLKDKNVNESIDLLGVIGELELF